MLSRSVYIISAIFLALLSFGNYVDSKKVVVEHLGSYPRKRGKGAAGHFSSNSHGNSSRSAKSGVEQRGPKDFFDRNSRVGFIRKVYTIFSSQALMTFIVAAIIMNNQDLGHYLISNVKAVLGTTFFGSLAITYSLVHIPKLRFQFPMNLLLLGIYTFLQSIAVGTISSIYSPQTVFLGAIHTLVVFLTMTVFAFQPNPRYDLTPFGNALLTSLASTVVGTILNIYFHVPFMTVFLSGVRSVIFATYIAYDTQLIIGGKHKKKSYSQNEYILASLGIYQDVISLFFQLLSIIEKLDKGKTTSDTEETKYDKKNYRKSSSSSSSFSSRYNDNNDDDWD